VIESLFSGISDVIQPTVLLVIFAASIIGVILGIIPGISGMIGCALALPFIFTLRLDPVIALTMLLALASVGLTGGSVTAILLNIPGDDPNAATLLDGYPMTRKGQSGRAIGAAVTSGVAGGIISVPMALILIPLYWWW